MSKIKLVPLSNKVVVKRKEGVEVETTRESGFTVSTAGQTAGGLYIPSSVKAEVPQEGTVLAAGAGRYVGTEWQPSEVVEGDHVLFGKFAGQEVKIDDETFVIMSEDEVLGVVRDA